MTVRKDDGLQIRVDPADKRLLERAAEAPHVSVSAGSSSRVRCVVQPFPLRSELPPDHTTVVLRAGVMDAENVRRAAERTFALYAVYGISVEGVIGETVQDACRSERIATYRRVRLSTFGRLRDADPRVARIVAIDADGNIELEVLTGNVEVHKNLLAKA